MHIYVFNVMVPLILFFMKQSLFLSPGIVDDYDPVSGLYSACKKDYRTGGSDCLIYESDGTIEARVVVTQRPLLIPPYMAYIYE
jgi:hypothetical protein